MNLRCLALPVALALAACGGEDEVLPIDSPAGTIDGATLDASSSDAPIDGLVVDAPVDAPSSVQLIANCTGVPNPDVTVSAGGGVFDPQNPTLPVNGVLRYEPGAGNHDMAATNGEFATPMGEITCLRFTAAGTFPVRCTVHGFTGTVTVTAN